MIPYKFLNIENHADITRQLERLFLNSVYLSRSEYGDRIFTFDPSYPNQPLYDITRHRALWNYVPLDDVFGKCPDIKAALDSIGLEVAGCSVLVITKDGTGTRLGLHSDASIGNVPYRLNWPVFQCLPGTKTSMYKLKPGAVNLLASGKASYTPPSQHVVSKSDTGIYRLEDIDSEVGCFIMDRPLLFNYTIPHRVYDVEPKVPYPRILISFDLEDNGCEIIESLKTTKVLDNYTSTFN